MKLPPMILLLVVAVAFASGVSGCAGAEGSAGTDRSSQTRVASQDTTAEARATLERLFSAWSSKDASAAEALLPEKRRGGEWEFDKADRIEFGPITDNPAAVAGYMSNGLGSVSGVKANDVRAFRATMTYFYEKGETGALTGGEGAAYTWFLERRRDGGWQVTDWGY